MTMFDFIRDAINIDNPAQNIPGHLPELSLMYHLFAGRSDIDIYTSVKDGVIGFSVLSEKEDDARNLKQVLDNTHHTAYGVSYLIKAKLYSNNTVRLKINREGS